MPTLAVARYWGFMSGMSLEEVRQELVGLAERELLTLQNDAVAFHDLQRNFLLLQADDVQSLHRELLAAYRRMLPPGDSWARLPPQEPYIWEQLLYHLRGAGDPEALSDVVRDAGYLAVRSFLDGPYAAEADLRVAADLWPRDDAIAWLLNLFAQWGHLLAGHESIGDLAATLLSRLGNSPVEIVQRPLIPLLPRRYLSVSWGLQAPRLPVSAC